MMKRHVAARALLLLVMPGSATALAQPVVGPTVMMPVDPVASERCRTSMTAFGCANAANLAAMARAADLVAGRPLAPADGALEAAAVERLLTDKVKDLRREGTGAGGGGPQ